MQTKEYSWTAEQVKATKVHTCKDFEEFVNDEGYFENKDQCILTNGLIEVDFRKEAEGVEIRINGEYEGTISYEEMYELQRIVTGKLH